ncbi:MAG TPA: hypothetical protein EYG92_00555 [Lutibacter sp.]|nr:hypothetical protein [Lutibacter sp.]
MKTTIKFLVALTIIFSFTSCEKIDELTDVKFDTTVSENIDVTITPTKGVTTFDEEVIIDLKDGSGDINDYLQYIKEIDVKEFQYEFISTTADATISAKLFVDDVEFLSIQDISLNQLVQNTEAYLIEVQEDLDKIAIKLESNKKMTIRYEGEITTDQPVDFRIKVTSLLGITADPI